MKSIRPNHINRYLWICSILLIMPFLNQCVRTKTDYDVIIVGGGVAGLSAAKNLNGLNTIILEKDSVLGGRVKTLNTNGHYIDLGADYVLHESMINTLEVDENIVTSDKPIAYLYNDRLYSGPTPYDCMKKVKAIDQALLDSLHEQLEFTADKIDTLIYDFLNTNIKSVFPAALKDYNIKVSKFAWQRYNSSHFEKGNKVVVDYLMKGSSINTSLNSSVFKVADKKKYVAVEFYDKMNHKNILTAKKAIVTTPSMVALEIIDQINSESKDFLENISYASFLVLSFVVNQPITNNDFAYVLPVNSIFSNIVLHNTMEADEQIFQFYIAHEDLDKLALYDDINSFAKQYLYNLWRIQKEDILFEHQYFWNNAGPVINDHFLKDWPIDIYQPSTNVFLAGDYTWLDNYMPFGMIPAIFSGERAAQFCLEDF
ncbi:MAG: FAD-dependent oxidoreductase [Chitinophagales bacterium]